MHHLIPQNAHDMCQLRENAARHAELTLPHHTSEASREWIDYLRSETLRRSGFAVRTDADAFGFPNVAWRIYEHADEGVLHAWGEGAYCGFAIKRADPECEALLKAVFGLSPSDMPAPARSEDRCLSPGPEVEGAERAFFEITEGVVSSHGGVDGAFSANFISGRKEIRPKAALDALREAARERIDPEIARRRVQAVDAFPALRLWDQDIADVVDAGEPLSAFLAKTHGLSPSVQRELRAVAPMMKKRWAPQSFRGVFGPDVPHETRGVQIFEIFLGFSELNDFPMGLLAPVASTISYPVMRTLMNVLASEMGPFEAEIGDEHEHDLVEMIQSRGGSRVIRRYAEMIHKARNAQRRMNNAVHDMISGMTDLPEGSWSEFSEVAPGVDLRLVRGVTMMCELNKGLFSAVYMKGVADDVTADASGPWYEVLFDKEYAGVFIAVGPDGNVAGWGKKRFNKMAPATPSRHESVEAAVLDLDRSIRTRETLREQLGHFARSPRFAAWAKNRDRALAAQKRADESARMPRLWDALDPEKAGVAENGPLV